MCSMSGPISGISCVPRWRIATVYPRSRSPFTKKGPLGPVPPTMRALFMLTASGALGARCRGALRFIGGGRGRDLVKLLRVVPENLAAHRFLAVRQAAVD